ncbi:MAG: ABC transporter ATP-binding protein [Candidatus Bathyarchaeia archaeon]|jgi:iron(III) transport system ATP-binding protein
MSVETRGAVKRYPGVTAVNGVSMHAEEGACTVLLGPSGSGKTTLLRIIAGLEKPDEGDILIDDKVVYSAKRKICEPAEKRGLGMVFQSYAVWPHMKVFDNVAYPLRVRRIPKDEVKERVSETLEMLGLRGMEDKYAVNLSGGQQQRVALARSFVFKPKILLLDEPLSNLDAKLREKARFDLKELQRKVGITFIYVTHDQAEAMIISDKLMVMNQGRVEQEGTAFDVYTKPASEFVATFIGRSNILSGKVSRILRDGISVETGLGEINVTSVRRDIKEGQQVLLSIRPESLRITKRATGSENERLAKIASRVYVGNYVEIHAEVAGTVMRIETSPVGFDVGESVYISFNSDECSMLFQDS